MWHLWPGGLSAFCVLLGAFCLCGAGTGQPLGDSPAAGIPQVEGLPSSVSGESTPGHGASRSWLGPDNGQPQSVQPSAVHSPTWRTAGARHPSRGVQASVDAAPEGWSQAAEPDAVDEAYSPGASGSTSTCPAAVPPGGGLAGLSPLDRCLRLSASGEASEEINALLRERRFLLDACASMDHQLWEARVHLTSASLGWMGRGAGRRPVYFADCHGEGVARPLEGEAPACSAPAAAGATPAVGRVVHARAYGCWRPAMVVQQGADPGIVVVRWWHDARLCVLSVGDIVVTPASVQYDACTGPVPRMGGPPLCVGQAVYALFHGEWFPAVIRRFLPEPGGVQVVWTGEFSKSNVPLQDVRTVPAWMLDSTTVDDPDLRDWLEELTGRWPPWTTVAAPAGSIPEDPAAEEASSFMIRPI